MIANLDNDVYIKALVDEAYATIFTGSTTNTVAQKKVKRIFEAEGCHIGASAKHDTWEDKNGSFESVDAFLSRSPGVRSRAVGGSVGQISHPAGPHPLSLGVRRYPLFPLWKSRHCRRAIGRASRRSVERYTLYDKN